MGISSSDQAGSAACKGRQGAGGIAGKVGMQKETKLGVQKETKLGVQKASGEPGGLIESQENSYPVR